MDIMFEYCGHEITENRFAEMVKNFLWNMHSRIKRKRTLYPKRKPLNIQDAHWDAFLQY